jgi:hypothetical protein
MRMIAKEEAGRGTAMAARLLAVVLVCAAGLGAAGGCGRGEKPGPAKEAALRLVGPDRVGLFHTAEFEIVLPDELRPPAGQEHDAYDADGDGVSLAAYGVFSSGAGELRVPAFMMREQPDGPWKLVVRFMALRPGRYECRGLVRAGARGRVDEAWTEPRALDVARNDETGPLVVPPEASSDRRYLLRARGTGEPEAVWLTGTARAWVVGDDAAKAFPDEWCDRRTELFGAMRRYGVNTLYTWMAPWELLLVHQKQAEFWPERDEQGGIIDGRFVEHALDEASGWRPYASYDQGRALAMDRIVELAAEYDADAGTHVHLFLVPLPHPCLRLKTNQWDGERDENGEVAPAETPERLCGFARLRTRMTWRDFFAARPTAPRGDRRRVLWDYEANFFRYCIARWGSSRALGAWVLVDEVDGVGEGPLLAKRTEGTGWWYMPDDAPPDGNRLSECDEWHDVVVRMLRGELEGYDGDPYRHPVTSSTTAYDYRTGREINGTWIGGRERVDIATYHSYPAQRTTGEWMLVGGRPAYVPLDRRLYPTGRWSWASSSSEFIYDDQATWVVAARRTHDWGASIAAPMPRLITEFGYVERPSGQWPASVYGKKYPTVYHYAVWAALSSGHAGTPFDWNDGKEFGEMIWRDRPGSFSRDVYPINNYGEIANAAAFLAGEQLDEFTPIDEPIGTGSESLTCWAIGTKAGRVLGWAFVNRPDADVRGLPKLVITGLPEGAAYRVEWWDTWTGARVEVACTVTRAGGDVIIEAPEAFTVSVVEPERGPNDFRLNPDDVRDDGKDIAFKLIPIE